MNDLPVGFIIYVVCMIAFVVFIRGFAVSSSRDEHVQTELFKTHQDK